MATMIAVTKEDVAARPRPRQEVAERFLTATRLFRSLRGSELESLAGIGGSYRADRGQILYCEGELLQHLYLVQAGSVKLIRNSEEGKELIVGLVGPGQCFGAMAQPLLAPSLAQALEECVLYMIPLQVVRRAAGRNASFALDLLEVSEEQWVAAQATAARLAFETVPRRLASLLLALSNSRYGTLNFPLNQTEIANLIGSSRETVCSILNRLRREGMLSIVKGRIRVLNREQLAEVR
jgi:CRP/FNR family transcriptional regulator